jgi:hypothetical protein
MNISDEIKKLQQLRNEGVLTDEEFVQAKATVLASGTAQVNQPDRADFYHDFQNIQFQNELERLEREWEREREYYMVTDKYGSRHVPSKGGSLVLTLVMVGIGLFLTIMFVSGGAPAMFPLFGIIFILIGIGRGIWVFNKADEYQRAYQRYQQRRAERLAQESQPR